MRTTLDIDEDVLQVARDRAAKERRSMGAVLSDMARQGFHHKSDSKVAAGRARNGVDLLPARDEVVTMEHVRQLLDEEGV